MPRGTMELEIVEVGPSSRPLQYVSRPPFPPPPPPPPPPPLQQQQQQGEAGDAHAAPPLVQHFDSEKLPQTLVSEIRPFLRAANDIEAENPRVAYLCKFTCGHALFTLSLPLLFRYPAHHTPVRGNARLPASSLHAPRWVAFERLPCIHLLHGFGVWGW